MLYLEQIWVCRERISKRYKEGENRWVSADHWWRRWWMAFRVAEKGWLRLWLFRLRS
ncbi:hypothetical protein HanRHA438_Chr05g0229671 [Helianthus annuus]|uniref:Uncharacterized protein n=1 Tax=Helianthus annuus TaxID=4232 RepID=A0A251URI1_HELAN|nr:hypothetical protein HanXRQr2_Chr05g0220831 [Helianthus annuus]KAJ0570663.1 hypothetical protein HanHA300_Chr05g0180631 [Helianthus annuus]KAJ0576554.1 hypothetical protein HanIR_Chr05g0225731 [Helianthus annuus]KAJ0577560.1 hypothetical protein HanIR_Chr05g0237381 [Helianthus annuus]KAJ0585006.1 hypothetical protein HanHA89_Chr05g0195331 [Helianthus annuus]